MNIIAKSQEVLQAQVAAYGEYVRTEDNLRGLEILEHAKQLAEGDVPAPMKDMSHFIDAQGVYSSMPRIEQERMGYLEFLRKQARQISAPAHEAPHIAMRAQLLANYALFAPSIAPFIAEVLRFNEELLPATERSQAYMTFGTLSDAYMLQYSENEFVVRVLRSRPGRVENAYVQGALRAVHIRAAEKLVAVSYEHGVTVAKKVPGVCLNVITSDILEHVSEAQTRDFVATIHELMNAGINLDLAPGNVLYDPTAGFSVIDLQATNDAQRIKVPKIQAVRRAETAIGYITGSFTATHDPKETPRLKQQNQRIATLLARIVAELVPETR